MSTRFHRTALFAALLAFGLAGGVGAQTPAPTPRSTVQSAPPSAGSTGIDKGAGTGASATAKSADAKLSAGERRFVEKAARDGMAEVQLGKLAQEKAHDPQVKDFGRRMADDHGKANEQLKQLASTKGVTLPTEPDGKHKRLADKLAKMSGDEFDRTYMNEMVDDHKEDVKAFRDMAKSAKDAEIRSFASSTLPTLEEHLKMAQGIHASAQATAKKRTTTARSGTGTGSTAHSDSSATSGSAGTMSAAPAPAGGATPGATSPAASSKGGAATASGTK
jgi:putative membrane protein